ncbi:DEAD/DEAH box helicase [Actinomadura rayongensis]|uniref:AAA family ATPase n=1 Tax=Actinomadura rayongensis TaxID=1429076 RepID=A0A6I4W8S8_9ACTN|nr:AAA domain-containing protein [Actinomadura rayongensis]MXQ65961.1 AAA family ATPase [Actinomadura rayongensis]
MTFRLVTLPGSINLVPSEKLNSKVDRLARENPHLQLPVDLRRLESDLNARADGVAVTFSEPWQGGDWSLLLHLTTYTVRLFLTKKYQDAYTIASISPMRMHDHERLARGCLLVRPSRWRVNFDVRTIPRPSDSYWSSLVDAWDGLGSELATRQGGSALTSAQSGFLDTLEQTVDASQRIDAETARSMAAFPYRAVTATGEQRDGAQSAYRFRLVGGEKPERETFVQVRGDPGLRGRVVRNEGDAVTVRFDGPVDWDRLARFPQGVLEATPSSVVFDKQREAIALLRAGQSRNMGLLPAVVEHRVGRIPPTPARATEDLDPDQQEAFRRGLATPDLLVVLGPPGTGKTRVIAQIAHAASLDRQERVLVTSRTNRAVDNVLTRLPGNLEVVRVGHTGVTADGKPYLLERRAAELRERVLNESKRSMDAYRDVETAGKWTDELHDRLDALAAARAGTEQARARHDAARRAVGGPIQVRVDELTARRDKKVQVLDRHRRRTERRARRLLWARAERAPVLSVLVGLLALLWTRRQAAGKARADRLNEELFRIRDALTEAVEELEAVTRDAPSVRAAHRDLDTAARLYHTRVLAAVQAARHARLALGSAAVVPPVREDAPPDVVEADLGSLLGWLRAALPVISARAALLGEWHADIEGATDQLYPELIRYADVIAATCTGTASRPEIADVSFDLAIVDEAGQIGVADALVPLVRAKRGVLVGDAQQLPPFLDSEVEAWGRSVGDPLVRDLLAKSALERLVDGLPSGHVVQLTRQRRMPAVIADFVSDAFYQGRLRTDVTRVHRDQIFAGPLAFVDTARLPDRERGERQGRARERWGQTGYVNPAEADLLVELAVHYHRRGTEWAVIVPYKAQVRMITAALAARIGDATLLGLNVGTVDSFQGDERSVILYGFTRANGHGDVGFLKELRRANVAFTRVQRQLVLVGDLPTLTAARDHGFAELARSLRDHVVRNGELRQYREVHDLVRKLNEQE